MALKLVALVTMFGAIGIAVGGLVVPDQENLHNQVNNLHNSPSTSHKLANFVKFKFFGIFRNSPKPPHCDSSAKLKPSIGKLSLNAAKTCVNTLKRTTDARTLHYTLVSVFSHSVALAIT